MENLKWIPELFLLTECYVCGKEIKKPYAEFKEVFNKTSEYKGLIVCQRCTEKVREKNPKNQEEMMKLLNQMWQQQVSLKSEGHLVKKGEKK